MADLKNSKDRINSENEFSKSQINNTIKLINYQLESGEKKSKELMTQNIKFIKDDLKEELNTLVTQIDNIKIENGKYHLEAMNKVKDIKNDSEAVKKLKTEITDSYNKEYERLKMFQTMNYDNMTKDIEYFKKEISGLIHSTKVKLTIIFYL